MVAVIADTYTVSEESPEGFLGATPSMSIQTRYLPPGVKLLESMLTVKFWGSGRGISSVEFVLAAPDFCTVAS